MKSVIRNKKKGVANLPDELSIFEPFYDGGRLALGLAVEGCRFVSGHRVVGGVLGDSWRAEGTSWNKVLLYE